MKRIDFYNKLCYSDKIKMKTNLKYGLIGLLSALCTASLVLGTVLVARGNNKAEPLGQGGFETPGIPEVTESILENADTLDAVELIVQEESSDNITTSTEPSADPVTAIEQAEEAKALTYFSYRVQQGDMVGFIADRFDITQDTIISVNHIKQTRLIQVGQYLKIPSMPGILYTTRGPNETASTIAAKYKVDAGKCAEVNHIGLEEKLKEGTSLFVPDAALDWVTRQEINGDLFKKPLKARYYISSYYGWRQSPFDAARRTYHGGLDMACPKGTSIYPALAGKVTAAGFDRVYGNYVIISHHSGYKTLYAHMSKILTVKGAYVDMNTRIGLVGNTGLSTGPHLHFTVYKNGKSINPLTVLN